MIEIPLLSLIVFLPLLGGLGVLFAAGRPALSRGLALGVTLADLALVVCIFLLLGTPALPGGGAWLIQEDFAWLPALGIGYRLGADGVSLLLVLLTALLGVLCVLVSWRQISDKVASFHFFLLFLQTGVLGVFLARDLFLFYLFWELQLIPMFFLVGVWGHAERVRATLKFFIFTVAGSLLMLLALIGLYLLHGQQTGSYSFALDALRNTVLPLPMQMWLYAAFLLAFAVKVPLLPLHSWLPDTHTEAPTAGSVMLAGLLLKTGAYALLRFAFPLFPLAAAYSAPLLIALGLGGLFYASWVALAQTDAKRLVAYSSIAHMGLVVIGLAVWNLMTLSGAVLQMINHGLSTSALFIMLGMLGERVQSRRLADLGGLWRGMPLFSAFFLLFAMSSLGLPGLNNFVGEVLILVGAFQQRPLAAVLGFAGLLLGVIYILRLIQEILFGPARPEEGLWDLTPREAMVLGCLAAGVLFIGLHPGPLLKLMRTPLEALLAGPQLLAWWGR